MRFSVGSSWNAVSLLAAFLVSAAVLFGGASQRNDLSLALVELAAVPLLCLAVYRLIVSGAWRDNKVLLVLAAAVTAAPILQLVPLPAEVWTSLPGREQSVIALELLGEPLGWRPMSITPDATRSAIWALLPPVAILLGMMTMTVASRLRLGGVFVIGAVASVVLACAQLASGGEALYPYSHSSAGEFNGLSANRNHLATFILLGLPMAAAVGAAPFWFQSSRESGGRWLFGLYAALAIIAVALTRSRTGIVLLGPVLVASLFLIWHSTRREGSKWKVLGLAALTASAVAAVAAFGLTPILERFDTMQSGPDLRSEAWPVVFEAGNSVQPWGAGLGAFDPLFRSIEPLSDLGPRFFNRAHNDYLELWLEAGVVAAALIGLTSVWFALAWWRSWQWDAGRERPILARAAGFCVLIIMIASIFDYPLRTETIAVFLAFSLGCLTPVASPTRRAGQALGRQR